MLPSGLKGLPSWACAALTARLSLSFARQFSELPAAKAVEPGMNRAGSSSGSASLSCSF